MVQILTITESLLFIIGLFQVRLEAAVCLHAGLRHRLWTLPGARHSVAQRCAVRRIRRTHRVGGRGALLRIEIQ